MVFISASGLVNQWNSGVGALVSEISMFEKGRCHEWLPIWKG
jgi:hypothetical protein